MRDCAANAGQPSACGADGFGWQDCSCGPLQTVTRLTIPVRAVPERSRGKSGHELAVWHWQDCGHGRRQPFRRALHGCLSCELARYTAQSELAGGAA